MNITNLPIDSAINAATTAQPGVRPTKLHEAAQQFESLMINEMLKSAKDSSSSSGWLDSEGGDNASESTMDMAQAQFANALSKSGGLGLAKMIEKSVTAPAPHSK